MSNIDPELKQQYLNRSDYSPYQAANGGWNVIGSNGDVAYGLPSREAAENWILENMGLFDGDTDQ